jgi:uncharacterized membrane protein
VTRRPRWRAGGILLPAAFLAVAVFGLPGTPGAQPAAPPAAPAPPPAEPAPERERGPDIYFVWRDGTRLATGQNPYESILGGNMRENRKYPTYLPLYYLMVAGAHHLGVTEYRGWMRLWRAVVLVSHVAIALLLLTACWRAGYPLLGVFAGLFWGFNRWTLYVVSVAHVDFPAILCLLGSLLLFDTRRRTSLVLFGLSLALKQIAVFVTPLYLVWTWRDTHPPEARRRATARAAGWIALVPALVSLPFLLWNAEAFLRSILFSATRDPASHITALSLPGKIGLIGLPGRLPMFLLMGLVLWAAARGEVGRYLAVLLLLVTFVDFNAVFYLQYMAWLVPFLALAALDRRT